eukprot:scaffold7129_cov84-Skeletonema_dohrnii-CCMP3373.AAC.1
MRLKRGLPWKGQYFRCPDLDLPQEQEFTCRARHHMQEVTIIVVKVMRSIVKQKGACIHDDARNTKISSTR